MLLEMNSRGIFYPFKWSYWCGHSRTNDRLTNGRANTTRRVSINSDAIEEEPKDRDLGIQLNDVSKVNSRMKRKSQFSSIAYHF